MHKEIQPQIVNFTRGPFMAVNGDQRWAVTQGGVQVAMAEATQDVNDALVAVQRGNGVPHEWMYSAVDKHDVRGLHLTVDNPVVHQLYEHYVGHERFDNFKAMAMIPWWIHHGMPEQLATDMESLQLLNSTTPYMDYRRVASKTAWGVKDSNLMQAPYALIHDPYYFPALPQILKSNLGYQGKIISINHIPFPSPDNFTMLQQLGIPGWQRYARQYLSGWTGSDVISFHTQTDADHFRESVEMYLGEGAHMPELLVNPLGIDIQGVERTIIDTSAGEKERLLSKVVQHADYLTDPSQLEGLIIGANIGTRSDPIKRIPMMLEAIAETLQQRPDLIGRLTFVQQVLPHRGDFASYAHELEQIIATGRMINEQFAFEGWQPIVVIKEPFKNHEVLRMYNSLAEQSEKFFVGAASREGMCLSLQEGVIASARPDTAVVVSTEAGVGETLKRRGVESPIHGTPNPQLLAQRIADIADADPRALMDENMKIQDIFYDIQLQNWSQRLVANTQG